LAWLLQNKKFVAIFVKSPPCREVSWLFPSLRHNKRLAKTSTGQAEWQNVSLKAR
jgi:hypothetical protein